MNIAFAASEGVPFSKTGGLADVVGALPRALAALGHQVSVYLPRYRQTKLEDPATVGLDMLAAVIWPDIAGANFVDRARAAA